MNVKIGIIGGSGIYNVKDFELIEEKEIKTPFGSTSDLIKIFNINNKKIAFIPRHGKGHIFLPSEVPYKANIWALKSLGVEWLISISAVGSLKENLHPGDWVIPEQIIDRTKFRENTFFGNGIVSHISFAHPFCDNLRNKIISTLKNKDIKIHENGVYVCMEGPAFSTKAESNLYRSWNADIIGMTAIPEAKLAREAEISYATIAMITDYDCWREEEEDVNVSMVLETMELNTKKIRKHLKSIISAIDENECSPFKGSNKFSIMTDSKFIPEKIKKDLKIIGDYFNE